MKKLSSENTQQFQETKILACHMYSRYKQGKIKENDGKEKMKMIYRVYVQYAPHINGPASIKCNKI
jgi:major membrane immunogen (membrane-anchored lipoprotein)